MHAKYNLPLAEEEQFHIEYFIKYPFIIASSTQCPIIVSFARSFATYYVIIYHDLIMILYTMLCKVLL